MATYGQTKIQLDGNGNVHNPDLQERERTEEKATTGRVGRYELYENAGGEWQFRLKAANGEIIAVSEGYSSKSAAMNGIESVRNNARTTRVDEV